MQAVKQVFAALGGDVDSGVCPCEQMIVADAWLALHMYRWD